MSNPYLYTVHDVTRFMLGIGGAWTHFTAQQAKTVSLLAQMNPAVRALRAYAEQMNQSPTTVTLENFNALVEAIPGMADFAHRLPQNLHFSFGANANGGVQNKPLNGKEQDELHVHLNMADPAQNLTAMARMIDLTATNYPKPDYGITSATINGQDVPITKKTVLERDFVDLAHFDSGRAGAPKVLLGAPMSGHYSTLIRTKIQSYLNAGMDVYVVDINNPRDIPASKGAMGLNGLVDRYVDFIEHLGPGVHMDATCQATTPTLIASAWLAKNRPDMAPASLTLVAGPIDAHASPTEVSEYGKCVNVDAVKQNIITQVPFWFKGAGRWVNPGFMQVYSFMSMNPKLHAHSYGTIYNHHVVGNGDSVKANEEFYHEYLAWCDMDAAYNLETIERIFNKNLLARGEYEYRGEKINLKWLKGVPILTLEGEKDDISGPGQTIAAHDLITPSTGYHYEIPGVGHYGAFHGSKSRALALPRAFTFIHEVEKRLGRDHGPVLGADGQALAEAIRLDAYRPDMRASAVAKAEAAWQAKQADDQPEKDFPRITVQFPALSLQAA